MCKIDCIKDKVNYIEGFISALSKTIELIMVVERVDSTLTIIKMEFEDFNLDKEFILFRFLIDNLYNLGFHAMNDCWIKNNGKVGYIYSYTFDNKNVIIKLENYY